jgi:hypothetical protein
VHQGLWKGTGKGRGEGEGEVALPRAPRGLIVGSPGILGGAAAEPEVGCSILAEANCQGFILQTRGQQQWQNPAYLGRAWGLGKGMAKEMGRVTRQPHQG